MKTIRDEHLAGLSSMSELKAMQQRIDGQIAHLERRMRRNLTHAKDMYSLAGIAKTAFTVFDTIQSTIRYVRKGKYE